MEKKLFLVALHVLSQRQVMEQAKIIKEAGAHGVILVNHDNHVPSRDTYPNLFSIAIELKEKYQDDFVIGTNSLDLSTPDAMISIPSHLDIIWVDKGGIIETESGAAIDPEVAGLLQMIRPHYYGSELFKYRAKAKDPEAVVREASKHFHTLVTSGEETGLAPSVGKIREIREWIDGRCRLAIASGISIENVKEFLPYADTFISATSLCEGDGKGDSFFRYHPKKISAFRKEIDDYELLSSTDRNAC